MIGNSHDALAVGFSSFGQRHRVTTEVVDAQTRRGDGKRSDSLRSRPRPFPWVVHKVHACSFCLSHTLTSLGCWLWCVHTRVHLCSTWRGSLFSGCVDVSPSELGGRVTQPDSRGPFAVYGGRQPRLGKVAAGECAACCGARQARGFSTARRL